MDKPSIHSERILKQIDFIPIYRQERGSLKENTEAS
jgi:hypothetical protein